MRLDCALETRMAGGDRDGLGGAGGETLEVSIGRLPHTGSQLFGRERELAWLDRCWEGGATAASIVAWGGVGKSALVNAWLRGMARDGWRGAERVYGWSFFSQGTTDRITSADEFISAALRWFGDGDPTVGSPWDKGVAAGLHHDIARPRFLMIRGVSDLADGEDNAAAKKRWRAYACDVAAAYAIGLLRDGPVPDARKRAR
jgi:hypothetical protein